MAHHSVEQLNDIARELAAAPLLRYGDSVIVGEATNHWADGVPLRIGPRRYSVARSSDFASRGLVMSVAFNGRDSLFALGTTQPKAGYEHELFEADLAAISDAVPILCGLNLARRIAAHSELRAGDRWSAGGHDYEIVKRRVPGAYGQIKYGKELLCDGVMLASQESWAPFTVKSLDITAREALAKETWDNAAKFIEGALALATQRLRSCAPQSPHSRGVE